MVTKSQIEEALKQCYDPELLIDVWTLGLIYDIKIDDAANNIEITMTFTFPGCPYGPMLVEDITKKIKDIPGVKNVKVNVVFEPPWKPSDELRAMLGV
ncbi:metal-sulfur cluster assembly factor [Candidatus Woesearchaeota archaeon]|nr:metal-sulfur cluster assembly factor [Candidatus Woesearchaeota archaeon]